MNDSLLIELIREKKHEKAFRILYREFPKVRKLVLANGGRKEDAEDLFQEGLIIFARKAADPSFTLTSQASTYIYGVCRYLWYDELKKRNKKNEIKLTEKHDPFAEVADELNEREEKYRLAEKALGVLGGKCLELLKAFYIELKSMKLIAAAFGFSSEKIAKNQKYKCIERARARLAEMQRTQTNLISTDHA